MGPLAYADEEGESFLGRGPVQAKSISGETSQQIDKEVRKITDECYRRAKEILVENRDKLEAMAQALIQYETIDHKQIDEIMDGKAPSPPEGWENGGSDSDDSDGGKGEKAELDENVELSSDEADEESASDSSTPI